MSSTRVFLVDDHQLFLSGVRAELGTAVDVVGAASDVDVAVEMIRDRAPDAAAHLDQAVRTGARCSYSPPNGPG